MAALRQKLSGSTLIETVVASTLFLMIFLIAVETITRVQSVLPDDTLLRAAVDLQACAREFSERPGELGISLRSYDWGEIEVTVARYPEADGFREVCFDVRIARSRQTLDYRILTFAE
ncbi:MAG: hypothetical protein LBU80_02255 [Rikenellaceae bacterium]|jgi:hypothetical protein|nr:hypothetical protein [Rikenellaceae bacterium]